MILSSEDLLMVVDCENVFKSARCIYGNDVRVDYQKLKDLILTSYPGKLVHKYAYVAIKPDQFTQIDLLASLANLEYTVKSFLCSYDKDSAKLIKSDDYFSYIEYETLAFRHQECFPSTVVVVCGSNRLIPMYRSLTYMGITVEVFGIIGSVSSHILGVNKHFLDEKILAVS